MSQSTTAQHSPAEYRELYSGLIRLHLLYHASKEPIFGLQMIAELGRHGYRLSPGTLYPVLHGMERRGLLRSIKPEVPNGRRVYRATAAGRKALRIVKQRVRELFRDLLRTCWTVSRPSVVIEKQYGCCAEPCELFQELITTLEDPVKKPPW